MQGKLKKLKDSNNQYVYPVSVSEAVFVDANKTLKTKLSEMETAISNASSGGQTVVSESSLFIRDSVNLLNPAEITQDQGFTNPTTNTIGSNTANSISGYIPVSPNLPYFTTQDYMLWAWYDNNKAFISGHYGAGGINTGSGNGAGKKNDSPSGATYLRISGTKAKMNATMVLQASTNDAPTDFIPYDRWGFAPNVTGDKLIGTFEGKTMNVFGDSISMDGDGSSSLKRGDRWTGAFERELKFRITNFAIGGSRMTPEADGTDQFKSVYNVVMDGSDGTKTVDFQSDYTIIFSGTNDHSKNMPLGTIADTTSATFYGSYKLVIQKLLTQNIDLKLFLVTPIQKFMGHTTTDNGEGWFWNEANGNGDTLNDFAQAIRNIGELYSIPVIDLHRKSRINEFTYTLYHSSDYLHPSKEGQRVMADAMKKEMF